ncbi:MAG: hypothetical protein QOH85_787 [Acidobacteriaceae bacterium]|jgi:hypothetical protein|nr:hypothetical protein [Acidobacteriaceae bacterium]
MKEVLRVPLASALALQFNAFFTLQASEVAKKTAPGGVGAVSVQKNGGGVTADVVRQGRPSQ